MDSITPVAAQVKTPDAFQTLNSVLGLQSRQLDIQKQQQDLQSATAGAQRDTQAMQERLAIQKMMKSGLDDQGNSIRGQDGQPDVAKVLPALGRIAPLTGQDVAQNIIKTHNDNIGLQASSASLDAQERGMLMGPVQAAALDPTAKATDVNAGIDNLLKAHPEMANAASYVKNLVSSHWDNVPPAQRAQSVQAIAARLQGGQAVQTQPASATIDTGGQIQPGVTAPAVAGGGFTPAGSAIQKTTAPALTTGPGGQLVTVGPGGSSISAVGGPGQTPGPPPLSKLVPMQRPGLNAPAADQANYQARIKAASDEYGAVSAQANDPVNGVQSTRFRNQQILDLIPHASTGPGMGLLNKIASRIPGSSGDAYQDLEHYTAQNSAALAKIMGVPGTNLGAETAAAAAGNVERNPGALREITKTNDALNTAFDLYNRGLAKVTGNGSDMSRAASYKQAFGQNLDVNAIRWADAHRRGDTQEIQDLTKKLGNRGIADAQSKLKTLGSLASAGDLP